MNTAQVREAFLKFFESKGCTRERSSSLVPVNDPTLLFTSAGMVQFKDVFTGIERRAYTRATTAQKCLRAGGKHNDLENVGFTARHHTFFEMLGNFSFGDYFKKEAITWAWELCTQVLKLPKDRLYVTVFRTDDEAYDIWHKTVGVPKDHIFRFDEKDNFWAAGDVGPCGPCTEIYFDRGPSYNTGDAELDRMGGDGGRYLEFYNLVFMQYNRDAQGNLSPLPKPSVDTGMGLERISSILQDVPTNYDIDLFHEIFAAIEKLSNRRYQGGSPDDVIAMRVVADHLRAVSFLVADGVMPSNEGRGYVLRRILRRAVRYGKKLGFEGAFLEKLVPALVKSMGAAYPEIREKENFVRTAIKAEEDKFFETLGRGLEILVGETAKLQKGGKIPGDVVFLLYDSFGFPVDLTRVIAAEQGLDVDDVGFEKLMERQRAQSRGTKAEASGKGSEVYAKLASSLKPTEFTGYADCEGEGTVLAILVNGQEVKEVQGPAKADLVFDRSPFYGESGGQVGDTGEILDGERLVAKVLDVKKPLPELTVVKTEATGLLRVGSRYFQRVPEAQRRRTAANHSATHLLHWALRQVLGSHVKQAGSLVSPDLLRFDFTHFQAMKPEELARVEALVNERVEAGAQVSTRLMKKDDAIQAGAMALFGEKYDSEVRVVSMAESTELCGGVHVGNTSEIRLLLVTSEAGIAAGVRRITALTGQNAVDHMRSRMSVLNDVQDRLKAASPEDVLMKVERLQIAIREHEKKIQALNDETAGSLAKDLVAKASTKNGVPVLRASLTDGSAEFLKAVCERARSLMPSGLIALAIHDQSQGKVTLMVSVSPDLTKTYNAGKLIQAAAPLIGGKGGGKPEQAQAGGTNASGISAALDQIVSSVSS